MSGTPAPPFFVDAEDWALGNPKGRPQAEVRVIRDRIRDRVLELIKEL
jgi:hypothetical protein